MTRFLGYIAMSLDGRISGPGGAMDWLHDFDGGGTDHGYAEFYRGIDGLVMGRTTYEFVRASGPWPYARKPTYVVTTRNFDSGRRDVTPVPPDFAGLRAHLVAEEFDRIWIVGGGVTQQSALVHGMLDELRLFVMPVVLGAGAPLFGEGPLAHANLAGHKLWPGGAVELIYRFGS